MNFSPDQLTQLIQTFGTLVVGLYLVYKHFTSGGAKITRETLEAYKERNLQLDGDIKDLKNKFIEQGKEIAHLGGVISEKDKHIESLTKILQNRNPELERLLDAVRIGQESVTTYMKESIKQSKEVADVLKGHSTILQSIKLRNEKIDGAHISALIP